MRLRLSRDDSAFAGGENVPRPFQINEKFQNRGRQGTKSVLYYMLNHYYNRFYRRDFL